MLQKLRNYLTPMVSTIALVVLGATALAVTPQVVERLANEQQVDQVLDTQDPAGEPTTDPNEVDEIIDGLDPDDLVIEPIADEEGDAETPTDTPTAKVEHDKPNHGHFVSCVAHMAKSDPQVSGRQKGAIVSAAARQKTAVMAKGAPGGCTAAYEQIRGEVLAGGTEGTEEAENETVAPSSVKAEKRAEQQLRKEVPPASAGAQVNERQSVEERRPSGQGPNSASQNGRGQGPKR